MEHIRRLGEGKKIIVSTEHTLDTQSEWDVGVWNIYHIKLRVWTRPSWRGFNEWDLSVLDNACYSHLLGKKLNTNWTVGPSSALNCPDITGDVKPGFSSYPGPRGTNCWSKIRWYPYLSTRSDYVCLSHMHKDQYTLDVQSEGNHLFRPNRPPRSCCHRPLVSHFSSPSNRVSVLRSVGK